MSAPTDAKTLIEQFLVQYRREYDYYERVGGLVSTTLETALKEAGIRAIVTYRPKSPKRLREKCEQRSSSSPYTSLDDVYRDIVDLVGVRVALYFPGERDRVGAIVRQLFTIEAEPKVFPRDAGDDSLAIPEKRFSGYAATHYRVHLRREELTDENARYADARVEVQIASVLMHAWSEVEHDLIYKPLEGRLSDGEYAILDQLNGLVLTGEIALETLQEAGQSRIRLSGSHFNNHYELAGYLVREATEPPPAKPIDATGLGRVDELFALLEQFEIADASELAPYLRGLHQDYARRPLAEQLIDAIRAELDTETTDAGTETTPSEASPFLHKWREIEDLIRKMSTPYVEPTQPSRTLLHSVRMLQSAGVLDDRSASDIDSLRQTRNDLADGWEPPSPAVLAAAAERAETVLAELRVLRRRHPDP